MGITDRIDSVTLVENPQPVMPPPKSVKIELSPRCNFQCRFCGLRQRKTKQTKDMDFDLFKKMTAEMVEAGVEEIGLFFLGESFMNPDLLIAACRYAKQEIKVPYVFLTTNGSLAYPQHIEELMKAGLDSLKFSVNASDLDQFELIMDVPRKNYMNALANIRSAWEVRERGGHKTGLYASTIKFDGQQHEDMQAILDEYVVRWVDQHYELPLYQMAINSDQLKDQIGYTPSHGNMARIDEETGLPNRKPLPCWSVFNEGHVRANGALSVCCFGADERFDIANLADTPFMEAWNHPKFQEIRAAQIATTDGGSQCLEGTMCEVCVAY